MSFDLDDPLAGILSDGSDDSFFDDDILSKKKPPKKKVTTPLAEKKNALFDLKEDERPKLSLENRRDSLFDLGAADSKKPPQDDNKSFKAELNKSPSPFKRTISKESIKTPILEAKSNANLEKNSAKKVSSSADKLNFLGDITEPRAFKPLEKEKSSQSLLDDILGGSSTKTGSTSQPIRPVTAGKSQEFDIDSILGKSESKVTVDSQKSIASNKTVVPQKTAPKNPKEDQLIKDTAAKKPRASEDWLGLFQNKDASEEDEEGMPAWLVGDAKKTKSDSEKKQNQPVEKKESRPSKEDPAVEPPQTSQLDLNLERLTQGISSSSVLQLPSNEDITAEGANLYMQQQESQLMLALQLKAQDEKLAAIQVRQKETQRVQREAAQAHHAQLDAMLQRQAAQRQQMQALIAAHQERITQRIKALLDTTTTGTEQPGNLNEENYEVEGNSERRETPHMKEKKQLLQLVQSLQENHDKEIDLMETSYRRQLAFLEFSIAQSEERLKEESDKLLKYYTEKIAWLEEHHQLHRKLTEDNLNSLAEQHKSENEMLRQQHLENIRVLQEHHSALMENIKNAVKHEQNLIRDSASFTSDLQVLMADVKESKSHCQMLVDRVQELAERTQGDAERSLASRETLVADMINQLKRERENFETEKTESRDMAKMLEARLKQMTTIVEEDVSSLKQKKMEFDFEKATFSKQTEFAKNVLQRRDEEIKMLKEDIQKEYQEKVSQINEEKAKAIKDSAAIAKEKASIQNLKQELEKTKAELQAQLEEVMEERSKLNMEKQHMHMDEQRILAKTRDLDLLAKTAIEKQTQADQKYAEAEFIQKKYEERIRRMQEQSVSLNAREKQIAKEKVALSRERLSLHNERKQLESKMPCSLCKSQSQSIPQYNFEQNYNFGMPDPFLNVPVTRDYANTNVSSAMNAIEHEMAHLLSKNLNLKYAAGVNARHQLTDNEGFTSHPPGQDNSETFRGYMDPKFMMLRLDVQQVLSNLDHANKDTEKQNKEDENDD